MNDLSVLNIKISSPNTDVFHGNAHRIQIPLEDGLYEITPGHSNTFFELHVGGMYVYSSHGMQPYFITSGICVIHDDHCHISVQMDKKTSKTHLNPPSHTLTTEQVDLFDAEESYKQNSRFFSKNDL